MKKLYFAILLSLFAVAACDRAADVQSNGNDGHVLCAYYDDVFSKSVFTPSYGTSGMTWEKGDRINIFAAAYKYVYQAEADGSPVYFEPVDLPLTYTNSYYAVYPYQENPIFVDGMISAEVPAQQEVVKNSLAYHLAVAHSETLNMYFKNVCGLFRVRISEEGINRITIRGNADENLTGQIMVDASDASWEIVQGQKEVSLEMQDGQTFSEADYYVALLPQTFASGLTVTAYKTDGSSIVKNVAKEIVLERNGILGGEFSGGVWEVTTFAELTSVNNAQDLVLAPGGGFYMTVRGGSEHGIFKVSADGTSVTKLASTVDYPDLLSTSSYPWGGDFDSNGLFYFALKGSQKIATCTSAGVVTEYPVTGADLTNAMKVLLDAEDNLYVLARGSGAGKGKVYKIKNNSVLYTWSLTSTLYETICFNADQTAIFAFANSSGDIQMIDLADNTMTRVAGNGTGHSSARTYKDAIPGYPMTTTIGVVTSAICAPDGTIYFNDRSAKTLRKFIPDEDGGYGKGSIRTIAGKIWPVVKAEDAATALVKDGQGLNAVFAYPEGIALGTDGKTLYMVDGTAVTCKIRKITYIKN